MCYQINAPSLVNLQFLSIKFAGPQPNTYFFPKWIFVWVSFIRVECDRPRENVMLNV